MDQKQSSGIQASTYMEYEWQCNNTLRHKAGMVTIALNLTVLIEFAKFHFRHNDHLVK